MQLQRELYGTPLVGTQAKYTRPRDLDGLPCRTLGYHKATRVAQHNRASASAVDAVYDNANANEDIGHYIQHI